LALNKRKVLDAARKFAQKGAKAKALKEYQTLLQADPRDAKLLLEVGDAYRRWGQAAEAIAQYGKVAQQYRQDGFDARAVAVYKQILNLDPKYYAAYVSLSELYQRMGLDAEAIAALQTAADGFHKEGRKPEALELLRQMAALDPSNTTSRVKVAELLRQEGMESEALAEYQAVAAELERQGTRDQLITIQERILEFRPEDLTTLTGLARNLLTEASFDRAESAARKALEVSPDPAQYELLIDLYAQMGSDTKLAETTRALAKLHRERGDDEKARELMQRLPAEGVGSGSGLAADVSEVEEPLLGDEEILDDDPFDTFGGQSETKSALDEDAPELDLGVGDEISLDLETSELDEAPPAAKEPQPGPEGDPDQLLAEASVYLRYGKREQAFASLRAILAQEPDHRGALEKLGDAHADEGQPEQAVEAWCRVAEQVRAEGDAEALGVLRDRIAALDPSAAARIGDIEALDSGESSPGPRAGDREAESLDLDLDLEVELDLDEAIEDVAASDTRSGLALGSAADAEESGFEIAFDDDPVGEDETAQDPAESGFDLPGDEQSPEFEFDEDELSSNEPSVGVESSMPDRVEEELEEAEFYLAQEMLDEAEAILARILESLPEHPRALEQMKQVRVARSGSPTSAESIGVVVDADVTAREIDEKTERLADDEIDVDVALDLGGEVGIEVDVDVEADDTTEEAISDAPLSSTDDAQIAFEVDLDDEDESPAQSFDDTTPAFDAGETFDLREALADVLSDDEEPVVDDAPSGVLSTVEDGFESIFADFKKGVTATLEKGDYDTRYDLGIAYREMGLFEDAIGEFRVCLDSEARRFDSLYLMGLCARDLTQFDAAVSHLEQALALPEIPSARLAGVYFDLSLAHEGAGDLERARASLESVLEIDPDFPGAASRLAALGAGGASAPELGQPGERFESFDDLFDGDDDESGDDEVVASVPAEAYASLDEIASEVEAELDEDPFDSTGSTEPDDTQSRRKGGRKKISFV